MATDFLVLKKNKSIVTIGYDGAVIHWNLNGRQEKKIAETNLWLEEIILSADQEKVAIRTNRGFIQVWNLTSGRLLSELFTSNISGGGFYKLSGFYFSSDSKHLLTLSSDQVVRYWDVQTGSMIRESSRELSRMNANTVCFSNDGKSFYTGLNNGTIIQRDVQTFDTLAFYKGHSNGITKLEYLPKLQQLISSSSDSTLRSWNVNSTHTVAVFKGQSSTAKQMMLSSDKKLLLTSHDDGTVRITDLHTMQPQQICGEHKGRVVYASFFNKNQYVISYGIDKRIICWDIQSRKQVYNVSTLYEGEINYLSGYPMALLSPDERMMITYYPSRYKRKNVRAYEAKTGNWLFDIDPGGEYTLNQFSYSNDSRFIHTIGIGDTVFKVWSTSNGLFVKTSAPSIQLNDTLLAYISNWNVTLVHALSGQILHQFKHKEHSIYKVALSADGTKLITISGFRGTVLTLWDMKTAKLISEGVLPVNDFHRLLLPLPGSNKFVLGSGFRNSLFMWDTGWKPSFITLKGHTNLIRDLLVLPSEILASLSSELILWNSQSGKQLSSFYFMDKLNFIHLLPDGYYTGTKAAVSDLYYVNPRLQVITFDQLDLKYNRPDKVLEATGSSDTTLIHAYRRAYYKRIKKAGIDTTRFNSTISAPELIVLNKDSIDYEQKNGHVILKIYATDSLFPLTAFNLWANDVPLFGMRGINIRDRNIKSFDTTISVTLTTGENKIVAAVVNSSGTESYHMPLYVKYIPYQPVVEKVYFIGIGLNQFEDKKHNLKWCVKDIRDLALQFKRKYPAIQIDTLFDEQVNLLNVRWLKEKLLQTTIHDKVIIAYSGHGLLSKEYDYYLSSYDINFSKPEENGILYEEIENLLDGIPARKKLLLLDACHSGEVDKEEMLTIQTKTNPNTTEGMTLTKGSVEESYHTKTVGLQNSFELMQSLFVNVGKGTGTTIISAAGGVQFALERGDLKNGVFTYSILEAMRQHKSMTVSRLRKQVGVRVEELTNGLQKPTTREELKEVDWWVW
jgi:WD40 repeat protein